MSIQIQKWALLIIKSKKTWWKAISAKYLHSKYKSFTKSFMFCLAFVDISYEMLQMCPVWDIFPHSIPWQWLDLPSVRHQDSWYLTGLDDISSHVGGIQLMTKPSLLDKIETFLGAAGAAKERGRSLIHFYKYHISAGVFFSWATILENTHVWNLFLNQ